MKHCDFPGSLQFSLINFVWDIEVGGASAASPYLMLVQAGDKLSKLSKFCSPALGRRSPGRGRAGCFWACGGGWIVGICFDLGYSSKMPYFKALVS